MDRRELNRIRSLLIGRLAAHGIGIAAVTGKEVGGKYLTLTIDEGRYPVQVKKLQSVDIRALANVIKRAHENAQK